MLRISVQLLGWAHLLAGCGTFLWASLGLWEGRITVSARWTKPFTIDIASSFGVFIAAEILLFSFAGFFFWIGWTLVGAKINRRRKDVR